MPVALLRCVDLPEPDIDEAPLLSALRDLGIEADTPSWDDPGFDPGAWDLCVLRATWNYAQHPDAFGDFVDRMGTHGNLWNPAPVVHANLDKRYLSDLERAGVPVVPTFWVEPSEAGSLADRVNQRGWTDLVVKPTVSAGSFLTKRFDAGRLGDAEAFLRSCLDGTGAPDGLARTMMVQRYMPMVETVGERSLVWIDGQFTHAVHKHPRFDDQDEFVEATELSEELHAFGQRVLEAAGTEGVRYARVDVIPSESDAPGSGGVPWLLTELELIEPSLFFIYDQSGAAVRRMASAIRDAAASRAGA